MVELSQIAPIELPHMQDVTHLPAKIRQLLQEFKAALIELYGDRLTHLVLYGSFARNEQMEGSDVDVLVVLKDMTSHFDEIQRVGIISTSFLLKYNELISIVPMDEDNFLYRESPLMRNIRLDGILL
jgi:uncharacterized protein